MKKLVFALSLVPALAFAEMKIATVNMLVLARNHPRYEEDEKFLKNKSADLKKLTDDIKAEGETLQSEGKKLMEQFNNPMLNDKAKADLSKQLQDIQKKLIEIEQRYRTEAMRGNDDIQADQNRFMKATAEDIRARIKAYVAKHGINLVLDTAVTAYADESLDITDAILTEMGVDPRKAKGKEKHEGK